VTTGSCGIAKGRRARARRPITNVRAGQRGNVATALVKIWMVGRTADVRRPPPVRVANILARLATLADRPAQPRTTRQNNFRSKYLGENVTYDMKPSRLFELSIILRT